MASRDSSSSRRLSRSTARTSESEEPANQRGSLGARRRTSTLTSDSTTSSIQRTRTQATSTITSESLGPLEQRTRTKVRSTRTSTVTSELGSLEQRTRTQARSSRTSTVTSEPLGSLPLPFAARKFASIIPPPPPRPSRLMQDEGIPANVAAVVDEVAKRVIAGSSGTSRASKTSGTKTTKKKESSNVPSSRHSIALNPARLPINAGGRVTRASIQSSGSSVQRTPTQARSTRTSTVTSGSSARTPTNALRPSLTGARATASTNAVGASTRNRITEARATRSRISSGTSAAGSTALRATRRTTSTVTAPAKSAVTPRDIVAAMPRPRQSSAPLLATPVNTAVLAVQQASAVSLEVTAAPIATTAINAGSMMNITNVKKSDLAKRRSVSSPDTFKESRCSSALFCPFCSGSSLQMNLDFWLQTGCGHLLCDRCINELIHPYKKPCKECSNCFIHSNCNIHCPICNQVSESKKLIQIFIQS